MAAAQKKLKVVVQKPAGGTSFDLAEGAYAIEKEALDPIGAEIVELPAKTDLGLILAARRAETYNEQVLAAQEHNEQVPAGLPPGTYVAHKTGWVDGIAHDVAGSNTVAAR